MFCPKCGTTLQDGSQFCPKCGAQLGAPAPQQPAPQQPVQQQYYNQPAPQQYYQQPQRTAQVSVNVPNAAKFVTMFFALMCFIFGFLSLVHAKGGNDASLFDGNAFNVNAMLGIGKVLMIIQIVVFAVYLISQFINLNKFLAIPFSMSEKMPIVYFGVYAVALLFVFIGALIGMSGYGQKVSMSPAVCWYFAVVFCICGFVFVFKPEIVSNIIKKQETGPQQYAPQQPVQQYGAQQYAPQQPAQQPAPQQYAPQQPVQQPAPQQYAPQQPVQQPVQQPPYQQQ